MSDKIEKFEELIAWQKARVLAAAIYRVTDQGKFARDYGWKDQIQRAAVSIMSNIAEGFERGRPSEFQQFLSIAKASCAELRSRLHVALDAGYLDNKNFNELMTQAVQLGRIVGGLRAAIARKRDLS